MIDRRYCTNEELLAEIYSYQETGIISNDLGRMILLIAENVSKSGCFHSYTWLEDMRQTAVETVLKYINNFDPIGYEKPNPFAYFSTIIRYSFLTQIKKEKKQVNIRQHLIDKLDEDAETQKEFINSGNFQYESLAPASSKTYRRQTKRILENKKPDSNK